MNACIYIMVYKITRLILPLVLLFFPSFMLAESTRVWTADDLPMSHLQNSQTWVCNPDTILSAETTDSVDAVLNKLYKEKSVEAVVIVVKRLQGGSCYEFGMEIGRKYKIGNKQANNGLILLLSTEDRDFFILTGHGMESTLPDAICKRVENRYMLPYLKQGDWDNAILQTVKALASYIEKDSSQTSDEDAFDDEDLAVLGILLFAFIIPLFLFSLQRKKKCPVCGKRKYRATQETFLYTQGSTDFYRVTYTCSHCKHKETKIERRPHQNHSSGNGPTIIGGGFLGGSHGMGGGISGGSFGGGSFGGGGAGGRF